MQNRKAFSSSLNTAPHARSVKVAFHEFDAFANQHEDVPAYYLQVQEARPLSNFIAETYGVKHESPQIFIIQNGEVKWHTSHSQITEAAIEQHLS